jgi:hypothetical protein
MLSRTIGWLGVDRIILAVEVVDLILQLVFGSPNPLKLIMRIVINNKGRPLNCQGCREFLNPYKIIIKKGPKL